NFYYHNTATRAWIRDSRHRGGMNYRETTLHQQYGRVPALGPVRQDFRGHTPSPVFPGSREALRNRASARGNMADGRPPRSSPSGFRGSAPRPHAFESLGQRGSANHFGGRGPAGGPRGGGGGGGGTHRGGGGHHGR